MATRSINGTLDTFSVDSGSEITYVGGSTTGDKSDDVRGFEVNPGGTGSIIVNLEKTSGIRNVQIFQKDAFDGSSYGVSSVLLKRNVRIHDPSYRSQETFGRVYRIEESKEDWY